MIDISATSFGERTANLGALDTVRGWSASRTAGRADPDRDRGLAGVPDPGGSDPGLRAIIGEAVIGAQQELGRLLALAQAGGELPRSLDPNGWVRPCSRSAMAWRSRC